MSYGVNKILLLGNLGHDPELRYTAKGNAVVSLRLATSRQFKTAAGEIKNETHWHKASAWGKNAENCAKYLVKGSRVFLEGEMQMKSYTDKEGIARKSAEILVDRVHFLDSARRELANALQPEYSEQVFEAAALTH